MNAAKNTAGRTIASVLAVLLVVFASLIAGADSASAQTAPMPPSPEFPYPHDGCTRVPEAPSGVSFTTACNHHDGCYGSHQLSRAGCDLVFYREMVAACQAQPNVNYACRSFAGLYYVGVRVFGQPYYDAATPAQLISTPMQS